MPPIRSPASEPSILPMKLLREVPTTSGRPSSRSSPSRRSSSRLCSSVLPKPIPGSSQIRSSPTPAAIADLDPLGQEGLDVVDDVVVGRVLLHRPRGPLHVHEDQAGIAIGAERRDLRDRPAGR